jgi:fluoroacetyl-CoA thioesterase
MNKLIPGIEGFHEEKVTPAMLAKAYCSGTLEVFATPSMIALMEKTAMESVVGYLLEGQTTVGTEVHVSHLKATAIGKNVSFCSTLARIDDRKLVFNVEAFEGDTLIGTGTHTRYIVDTERFLSKL